jgi:hypothetical protein
MVGGADSYNNNAALFSRTEITAVKEQQIALT